MEGEERIVRLLGDEMWWPEIPMSFSFNKTTTHNTLKIKELKRQTEQQRLWSSFPISDLNVMFIQRKNDTILK